MTEHEWLTSEDPVAMFECLTYRPSASKFDPYTMPMGRRCEPIISDRKLRLFIDSRKCDRCKIWLSRSVLNNALHCSTADCNTLQYSCNLLREIVGNPFRPGYRWTKKNYSWTSNLSGSRRPGRMYCYLPKDWLTPKVRDMAQHIYDSNEWDLMPQFGDLLEESGCDNEEILRHCRQEERCVAKGPYHDGDYCNHGKVTAPNAQFTRQCEYCNGTGWIPKRTPCVRGCWVVDLLLGIN